MDVDKNAEEVEQREELVGIQNEPETRSPGKRKLSVEKDNAVNAAETNKRRKSEDNEATTSANHVVVKTETVDAATANEAEPSSSNIPVSIKTEPVDENDDTSGIDGNDDACTSSNIPPVAVETEQTDNPPVAVKTEPTDNPPVAAKTESSNNPPATADSAAAVVKTESTKNNSCQSAAADSSVSSSTLRASCRFGIRCYRQNPAHRSAEAHPGDNDYRRPSFPAPPLGTPACPFGNICYRRNPAHFQQFSHPSDFNSAQNIRNRLRQRRNAPRYSAECTESDEEDPFQDDSDNEYEPGANVDVSDDDDDDLEFNSERQNGDDDFD